MLTNDSIRRVSAQAALTIAIVCFFGVLLSGPGFRMQILSLGAAFSLLKWSAYISIIAIVLTILNSITNKFAKLPMLNKQSVLALLISVISIGTPYYYQKVFYEIPTVADSTTNYSDPPQFVSLVEIRNKTARNPLEYRGEEATQVQQPLFPNLTGIKTNSTVEDSINYAEQVAKNMGLDIAAVIPQEGRLEATSTSFWFGFKDDLVVRAKHAEDESTLIDIRSASRIGYLDGGVNVKRVISFSEQLKNKLE